MGTITTVGKAEEKYQYDIVSITVRFRVTASKSSEALDKVLNDCEDFLSYLHDNGLNMDCVNAGKDALIQNDYRDEKNAVATREIKMVLPYETAYVNSLLDEIRKHDYDCEIDIDYELSNFREIHENLIKMAIDDSKHKAEMIAEALGQKIIGIESVEINKRYNDHEIFEHERNISLPMAAQMKYFNEISAATTNESENVEVVWQIEEK